MILPAAFLVGFAFGWYRAEKGGGDKRDKLQYGAAHGIAALILALLAAVFADRIGLV